MSVCCCRALSTESLLCIFIEVDSAPCNNNKTTHDVAPDSAATCSGVFHTHILCLEVLLSIAEVLFIAVVSDVGSFSLLLLLVALSLTVLLLSLLLLEGMVINILCTVLIFAPYAIHFINNSTLFSRQASYICEVNIFCFSSTDNMSDATSILVVVATVSMLVVSIVDVEIIAADDDIKGNDLLKARWKSNIYNLSSYLARMYCSLTAYVSVDLG